ncbi:uncharacterized protein LOC119250878 [Talpa occidentalis]|uniref:uncharacterized protein LOC119250878 n=1 Tax=Talpa occidentalis TaxID=50954 RepID=UPI00188F3525|nr:uncharacterized protein LOC119250878 [Talpa occidentalis]
MKQALLLPGAPVPTPPSTRELLPPVETAAPPPAPTPRPPDPAGLSPEPHLKAAPGVAPPPSAGQGASVAGPEASRPQPHFETARKEGATSGFSNAPHKRFRRLKSGNAAWALLGEIRLVDTGRLQDVMGNAKRAKHDEMGSSSLRFRNIKVPSNLSG